MKVGCQKTDDGWLSDDRMKVGCQKTDDGWLSED